jgi:peptidoglycan/xylan/chitin deacetylase (PgdA/CDA1 family)
MLSKSAVLLALLVIVLTSACATAYPPMVQPAFGPVIEVDSVPVVVGVGQVLAPVPLDIPVELEEIDAPISPILIPTLEPTALPSLEPIIEVPIETIAAVEPTALRLPIIEYHYSTFRMGEGVRMETDWFESQLQWLEANGFTTLSSDQLAAFVAGTYSPPQRSVVLTFDVGASKFDDYSNIVIPALRRHHFHGLFFILASRTLETCDDPTITCWPKVKQWADEGVISMGSHSWSHIDYTTLSPEQIYLDAARSKALIEEKTGHPVLGICYPFDAPNPASYDLLKSLGYAFAVGGYTRADRSALFNDGSPYNLPRYYPYSGDYYPIIGGTHGKTFGEMLLGAIE